jgi:tRNA (cmo5U34)-methyltransferase
MDNKKKHNVGDAISADKGRWSFSGKVSKTFDEHVDRSVPFYKEGHQLIVDMQEYFLQEESVCYEIGCSTGSLTKLLSENNTNEKTKYFGIDNVKEMIEVAETKNIKNAEFLVEDIATYKLNNSDLILSYYTIQFIKPQLRQDVIDKIYNSLNWGGGFFLFEKVRANDARFQDYLNSSYNEFKLRNNFTESEIFSKTRSLNGVLEPFSSQGNIDMLKRSGFKDIICIFKYLNFQGFLAIK